MRYLWDRQAIPLIVVVVLMVAGCSDGGQETGANLNPSCRRECGDAACFMTAVQVLGFDPSKIDPVAKATLPTAQRAPRGGPGVAIGPDLGGDSYAERTFGFAQGGTSGDVFNFLYWPYVDAVYYYYHAVFATPPTVWIDAAHRNGVPILGVMTGDCPTECGCAEELKSLFTDEHRKQTVDVMFNTLEAYGFDGWFLDFESGFSWSPKVKSAIEDLRGRTLSSGKKPIVMTYEARHQGVDSDTLDMFKASDYYFGDYSGGLTPRETFDFLKDNGLESRRFDDFWTQDIFFNADESCTGSNATQIYNGNIGDHWCLHTDNVFRRMDQIRDTSRPGPAFYTAMGFFAAEWPTNGGTGTSLPLDKARSAHQDANRFLWVGFDTQYQGERCTLANHDSINAVSSLIDPLPIAGGVPFVTRFDTGEGDVFAVRGQHVAKRDSGWNLLSMQDVAPTWLCNRSGAQLNVGYTYADPFDGGSALEMKGSLEAGASSRYDLYATSMSMPDSPGVSATIKTSGEVQVNVVLGIDGGAPVSVQLDSGTTWKTTAAPVPQLAGKTVTSMGIEVKNSTSSAQDADVLVGEIAVFDTNDRSEPELTTVSPKHGRLTWGYDSPKSISYANIYALDNDCNRFIGRTPSTVYNIHDHPLFDVPSDATTFTVQPVSTSGVAKEVDPRPCTIN